MLTRLPVFLLPALTKAIILVEILASTHKENITVSFYGTSISPLNISEREGFHMSESQLKSAVKKYCGTAPSSVFIRGTTPWGNLYKIYNWTPVSKTVVPYKAWIQRVESEPMILSVKELINNSHQPANFNVSLFEQIDCTVSTMWYTKIELQLSERIFYNLVIPSFNGKANITIINFDTCWGDVMTHTKAMEIGIKSPIEVTLKPGQSVEASLIATRGVIEVEVSYAVTVAGDIVCNFENGFKGHYFWKYNAIDVLQANEVASYVYGKEVLSIDFFTDAIITVTDTHTNLDLVQKKVHIVSVNKMKPTTKPRLGLEPGVDPEGFKGHNLHES